MTAALRLEEAPDERRQSGVDFKDMGRRAGELGLAIADIAGTVDDLARLGHAQIETVRAVVQSSGEAAQTNNLLAASMEEARSSVEETRNVLATSADEVARTIESSVGSMQTLSHGVIGLKSSLGTVTETIRRVSEASAAINDIARETTLVALNASIEAARLGSAGNGFSVIGAAVKTLAEQIGNFAKQNQTNLQALQGTLEELMERANGSAAAAESAIASSGQAAETTRTIQSLVTTVQQLTDNIDAMSEPVRRNIASGHRLREDLHSLVASAKSVESKLQSAAARTETILSISEDFILFLAESGVETEDTPLVSIAVDKAREISALFEKAVDSGRIGLADLFDEDYRPVPGSDPQQVLTRFTEFTDRVLPTVQEPVLQMHERIVFCAAVDRNGYLPTHNLVYSKPQGDDPVWNSANCRNHRIFDDRTGLSAGRNTRPFLVQTYRRDMGGGNFVLMKDISAPITVRGRHWGGLRMGCRT